MTQWAGERGFEHRVKAEGADGVTLVTGIVRKPDLQEKVFEPTADAPVFWRAFWGHQVVETGPTATATKELTDTNLGLAIITPGRESKRAPDDALNLLVQPQFTEGSARWYVLEAWDQEGSENLRTSTPNAAMKRGNASVVVPSYAVNTFDGFVGLVQETSRRLMQPAHVTVLSPAAAPQSAPPDTLQPARSKAVAEAIALIRQAADRTGAKWAAVIAQTPPAAASRNEGLGFFTEGDNQTGEWKEQKGFFWTGNFWVAELWLLYAKTGDARYRRWA